MIELVMRNYWWLKITKNIGRYINEYNIYQWMKNRTEVSAGNLMANKILKRLWTYLIVDFITKLLLVVKKNAILVVCDRLSKIVHFVATTEEISVEKIVRLFKDNIWKLYRLLESVILDRGLQFAIELTKELNKILEIETKLSTAFYP